MTSIIVPSRLLPNRQRDPLVKPTGNVEIDWSHPLAAGLTVCILFQSPEPVDLVRGIPLTKGGGAYFTPNGQYFDEVDDYYALANVTLTSRLSVCTYLDFSDNTGTLFQYYFSWGAFGVANSINLYLTESSYSGVAGQADDLIMKIASTVAENVADVDAFWPNDNASHYVFTHDSANKARSYVSGKLRATGAGTTSGIATTTRTLYIGGREDLNIDRFMGGKLRYLYVYGTRTLSAPEIASISTNPYQFLREVF